MADVLRLKRVLLSLPEIALRVGWLSEQLGVWPVANAATLLDGLCEQAESSDPDAREAVMVAALMFVGLGECELVEQLREEAAARRLLSLDRLLRRGPPAPVYKRRIDDLPVPDYGTGRELTVGERRSLARRPSRRAFDRLLSDPHPLVIRQLLENPMVTEEDVVRLATRRPARLEVMRELAQSPRWLSRPRVRMSVLLNPGSPPEMAGPLLVLCTRGELSLVMESTDAPGVLRATARELRQRRPPLRASDDAMLQ
jgi:hypothetical protein